MASAIPVTVLMPVFNGERYVDKAIESVLGQSHEEYEFLIIDDGSTDRTVEIVRSHTDQRIRLIRNERNIKLIASLNRGLKLASGKYIARMDCDDICHPERLKKQFKFMEENPDVGVLGTGFQVIDETGKKGCRYKFPVKHEEIAWSLSFFCPFAHPSVMVRRNVIQRFGGYSEDMRHAEDYDLWRRLSDVTRLANLEDNLLFLRKHEENITQIAAFEHRDNIVRVAKNKISGLLREDISDRVVQCIRLQSCDDVETARMAAKTINRMYEQCMSSIMAKDELARVIRRDASFRILLVGVKASFNAEICAMAIRLDKWVVFSLVGKAIRSLICRRIVKVSLSHVGS